MTCRETPENGSHYLAEMMTECLASCDVQSATSLPGGAIFVADGRNQASESVPSVAGQPGPDVIVISTCDPMTQIAGNAQWFQPFEVGRTKSLLGIILSLVRGTMALLLSLACLAVVAMIIVGWLAPRGRPNPEQYSPDLILANLILVLVLTLLVFLTLRGFVYWRVDQAGIHQYRLGLRTWSLSLTEIVSRELGRYELTWLFLPFIAIPWKPYQAIVLQDRQGRKRRINRMATNGDRLDVLVRLYVNPTREAEIARRYTWATQAAQAAHSRRQAYRAPLHFATKDTPVVRMKMHEPLLVPACCNCLGPVSAQAPIPMSPGLIGFLNDRFVRLLIPLCSECHARTGRDAFGFVGRAIGTTVLIMVGTLVFFLASTDDSRWSALALAVLGIPFYLGALAIVRNGIRRPSPEKLVKVVRANARQGWMDVRFGNADYARLIADLNQAESAKTS
jgi:hypothetical protein